MNVTEKMIQEISGFLTQIGEQPLAIPGIHAGMSEIELLRCAKTEYTRRLRQAFPHYRLLPSALIPDMFLQALRNREGKLKG